MVKIKEKIPLFQSLFSLKIEGKPITLVETTAQSSFKTGRRDFIYVKDLAEAILIAAESSKTEW